MHIHEKFNYGMKTYGNQCNNWESQIVELSGGVCNIYRLHSDLNENYKLCIDELSTFYRWIININGEKIENKKEVIITGDFNINLLKINEKEIFCDFPKITFPTRFSRTTST